MSYEGYTEYLCERGHLSSVDALDEMRFDEAGPYSEDLHVCPRKNCDCEITYRHSVDLTNGIDYHNPSTFPAEVKEVGYDVIPKVDFLGHGYFVKEPLYRPASEHWSKK